MIAGIVTGIADGFLLFLIASGLTLIFGSMRILNFSHGGYFMLGAYFAYQGIEWSTASAPSLPLFTLAVLIGALAVGAVGVVTERLLFRKMYQLSDIASLLGTFGLLLVFEGLGQVIWGANARSVPYPPLLSHSVSLANARIGTYYIVVMAVGAVVAVLLWALLQRTRFGEHVRAVATDRYMCELIGMNTARVSTLVFALGTGLAGLGGALATPLIAVTPGIATAFIIEAFAVVIVGGLGSVFGSLVAALGFGIANSLAIMYYQPLAGIIFFVLMFVVLLIRPEGLVRSVDGV